MPDLPSLIGVIHLLSLPESPRFAGDLERVVTAAVRDAEALAEARFDAVLVENFGDAPFVPGTVSPVTVAAMTACARAVRAAVPESVALGINVLRNDAEAALAIALVASASFIRINVHTGARLTDQGLIQGAAHLTLRRRRELGARIHLFCDVDVKHSAPIAARPIEEEAEDLVERGLADAVIVTGASTGAAASASDIDRVSRAVRAPVYVGSGATVETLAAFGNARGVLVGSALRASGRAGEPVDAACARRFADAFRARKAAPTE